MNDSAAVDAAYTLHDDGQALHIKIISSKDGIRPLLKIARHTLNIAIVLGVVFFGVLGLMGIIMQADFLQNIHQGYGPYILLFGLTVIWLGFFVNRGAREFHLGLWLLTGEELIVVNPHALTISRQSLGHQHVTTYLIDDIQNLRVATQQTTRFLWIFQKTHPLEEIVVFDYNTKTVRFGRGLSNTDAQEIVTAIEQRLRGNGEA